MSVVRTAAVRSSQPAMKVRRPRLPFAAEPLRLWPVALQQRWTSAAPASWRSGAAHRAAFGRFRAYCRMVGDTGDVTRDAVRAYIAWLQAQAPDRARRELTFLHGALALLCPDADWAWLAQLRHTLPGKPLGERGRPAVSRRTLSLAFEAWPEEDQRRWRQGLAPPPAAGGRLAHHRKRRQALDGTPSGRPSRPSRLAKPPAQWSAATLRSASYAYGAFLKAMVKAGREPIVTPLTVALWVEAMLERMALFSAANRVRDLWYAMRLLRPEQDWHWLCEDAEVLFEEATPVHDKRQRIVDVRVLRRAALVRMRRAAAGPPTVATALTFQDGLIMLLLACRPVRRRNLAETRLGVHLIVDPGFRSGRLCYDATKSGQRYEVTLPAALLPWLAQFITVYRPILVGPEAGDHAWLSSLGRPLSAGRLYTRMARATSVELGKRLPLHLFRDCLATTVSEIAPERIEDAGRVLGHAITEHRPGLRRAPAIEFYRQVAGTTYAGRKLAEVQEPYRILPRARRRATRCR